MNHKGTVEISATDFGRMLALHGRSSTIDTLPLSQEQFDVQSCLKDVQSQARLKQKPPQPPAEKVGKTSQLKHYGSEVLLSNDDAELQAADAKIYTSSILLDKTDAKKVASKTKSDSKPRDGSRDKRERSHDMREGSLDEREASFDEGEATETVAEPKKWESSQKLSAGTHKISGDVVVADKVKTAVAHARRPDEDLVNPPLSRASVVAGQTAETAAPSGGSETGPGQLFYRRDFKVKGKEAWEYAMRNLGSVDTLFNRYGFVEKKYRREVPAPTPDHINLRADPIRRCL